MTTYAVTGSTGQLGRKIVHALLDLHVSPFDVIAIARDEDKADDLAALGVRVREANYNDPASLLAALEGVEHLVLVSSSEVGQRAAQHANVIAAAETAGVSRIVYTSLLKADSSSNGLTPEHLATEQRLASSPIETVAARNSWYTENYTGQIGRYLEQGVIAATGEGRIAAATRADYAEAAAVIATSATVKPVYELGGEAFTMAEFAAALADASGKDVPFVPVTVEQLAAGMVQSGMDEGTAGFWASIDGSIAAGDLDTDSSDLEDLLGRKPVSLAAAIKAAL